MLNYKKLKKCFRYFKIKLGLLSINLTKTLQNTIHSSNNMNKCPKLLPNFISTKTILYSKTKDSNKPTLKKNSVKTILFRNEGESLKKSQMILNLESSAWKILNRKTTNA